MVLPESWNHSVGQNKYFFMKADLSGSSSGMFLEMVIKFEITELDEMDTGIF